MRVKRLVRKFETDDDEELGNARNEDGNVKKLRRIFEPKQQKVIEKKKFEKESKWKYDIRSNREVRDKKSPKSSRTSGGSQS